MLRAEGLESEPTRFSPWGLRIPSRRLSRRGSVPSGLVEVQDEGSQLVAALVDARPGMRVADWCAGAGGKTLALAMTMREPRPHRRVRRLGAPARRRGAAGCAGLAFTTSSGTCHGAGRQMGQAPGRELRPRAGRRALHRDRHLAAQSGCARCG